MVGFPTRIPGFTVIRFNNFSRSMSLSLNTAVVKIILYFVAFRKAQMGDL
jgi:uncharacterized membrane protein